MKNELTAIIIALIVTGVAWGATVAIRDLPTAGTVYGTDKVPLGRATNPAAIAATITQIRQPFVAYTSRLRGLPVYLQVSSSAGKSRLYPDGIYRNVSGALRKVVAF